MTPWPITELDEYELRRDDEERRRREADNRACGYDPNHEEGGLMYSYESEKHNLFTPEGFDILIKVRDKSIELNRIAGCFNTEKLILNCSGSSFIMLAAIDYLVEKGELIKIINGARIQYNVYRRA